MAKKTHSSADALLRQKAAKAKELLQRGFSNLGFDFSQRRSAHTTSAGGIIIRKMATN